MFEFSLAVKSCSCYPKHSQFLNDWLYKFHKLLTFKQSITCEQSLASTFSSLNSKYKKPTLLSYFKTSSPLPASLSIIFPQNSKHLPFQFSRVQTSLTWVINSSWVVEYFEFPPKLCSTMTWSFYTSEVCYQLLSPDLHFLRASAESGESGHHLAMQSNA